MQFPLSRAAALQLHAGKFTNGDPTTGLAASFNDALTFKDLIDSIVHVQSLAGIAAVEGDITQLGDALLALFAGANTVGSYRGLSFKTANYTSDDDDIGTIIELAGTTAADKTIKVIDGVDEGDALGFVNQSNFNMTIQIDTSSVGPASFIGVGVPVGSSFVIPAGGNAEIIWGGVNWRVNNFSAAYVPAAQGGSLRGINFQPGNYTTVDDDIGKMLQLAATATGNSTFQIKDGAFVPGQIKLVNQSNFTLTIQPKAGSAAQFLGPGVPLGTSFTIGPGGEATIIWGGVNWRVSAFSGNFSASGTLTATSGYEIHPDGTIEQWGTGTLSGGTATVTWPIAFPNGAYRASFVANTTATAASSAGPTMAQTNSVNSTGGTVWGATGATNTFTYRVKGY